MSESERTLIARIAAANPAKLRGYGFDAAGMTRSELKDLAAGTAILLIFGDSNQCPLSLAELTAGMTRKLALDTNTEREFVGAIRSVGSPRIVFRQTDRRGDEETAQ